MFVTEGCSRFEHQYDPDRTLWRSFEVVSRSRVFIAGTAPDVVHGPRTLFISTTDGLADVVSERRYGSVQQLCMIDCLAGSDFRLAIEASGSDQETRRRNSWGRRCTRSGAAKW